MRWEAAGDPGSWRQQAILGRGRWDADALRDHVVEHLADEDAVLVLDETGFLKQGKASCGVSRRYTGSAGKITNCQIGGFAAYVSGHGHAFIDRTLYLPKNWTDDPARLKGAHVPDAVGFATKPTLAGRMIERAVPQCTNYLVVAQSKMTLTENSHVCVSPGWKRRTEMEKDMTMRHRDDSPVEFRLSRRAVMSGGVLFTAALAMPPSLWAESSGIRAPEASPGFMEVSALLIAHHLHPEIGARLAVAMKRMNPALDRQIEGILEIARKKNAKVVEDFFPDLPEGDLKETALAIISAWYRGIVSDAPDAEVFAYELALMYQPTRDVMTIPSYAISGPNGWNAIVPPLSDMPVF